MMLFVLRKHQFVYVLAMLILLAFTAKKKKNLPTTHFRPKRKGYCGAQRVGPSVSVHSDSVGIRCISDHSSINPSLFI